MAHSFLTEILDNLQVNGKFNQDRLLVGRGIDEEIVLRTEDGKNAPGLKYAPARNGNPAALKYSNDGTVWHDIGSGEAVYEPIEFGAHNLVEGKLILNHNFGAENVQCLGFTLVPRGIDFGVNQLILDYSDRDGESACNGAVWFINSEQAMLTGKPVVPEGTIYLEISLPEPVNCSPAILLNLAYTANGGAPGDCLAMRLEGFAPRSFSTEIPMELNASRLDNAREGGAASDDLDMILNGFAPRSFSTEFTGFADLSGLENAGGSGAPSSGLPLILDASVTVPGNLELGAELVIE